MKRINLILNYFVRQMSRFNEKTKDYGFSVALFSIFILAFLHGGNWINIRYLYGYMIGCFFLGVIILCSIRDGLSVETVEINKPFFIIWLTYGGLMLLSGLVVCVDWLPEAMIILVAYPVIFFLWNNWDVEKIFSLLSKTLIATFIPFLIVCFLFFPITGAKYRGFFINQNGTAEYLGLLLICLAIEIYNKKGKNNISNIGYILLFGVGCAFLIYTNSRTGMIASLGGGIVLFFFQFAKRENKLATIKKTLYLLAASIVCFYCVVPAFGLRKYIELPCFIYNDRKDVFVYLERYESELDYETSFFEENAEYVNDRMSIEDKSIDDISTGRISVWKKYAQELNFSGHKAGGRLYIPELKDTNKYRYTAHNFVLQQAYDHGIITGITALLLNIYGGILALIYGIRRREKYSFMPVSVIVYFGIRSLVEAPTVSIYSFSLLYYYLMHAPLVMQKKNHCLEI